MIEMLKGGKNSCFLGLFLPTPAMKLFFGELHDAFTNAPLLAYFDPVKPIRLVTYA
jgi:hypothetical protein